MGPLSSVPSAFSLKPSAVTMYINVEAGLLSATHVRQA